MDPKLKAHSDPGRWVCIYPVFINSERTRDGGRVIPKDKVGFYSFNNLLSSCRPWKIQPLRKFSISFSMLVWIVSWTWVSIIESLILSLFQPNVLHPREPTRELNVRGRVRVQLKNDDGSFINANFKTRKDLMLYAAEMIPQLKSRQAGPAPGASQQTAGRRKKKKRWVNWISKLFS